MKIKNISKINIDKSWISLGIQIGKDKNPIMGPNVSELTIELHILIIHIRLGIRYKKEKK